MKHAIQQLHFTGIGGAGMSAIAEILHAQGFRITGSDRYPSDATRRLAALGVTVFIGHDAAHLGAAQALVVSSAIATDNIEILAARERGVPVVARAAMLAELMRPRLGIAVAGTHGKTTTTSLIASVLIAAGLDPGFVIGGRLNDAGANARLGSGEHIVVEADESDASFLQLNPVVAVITNIDADHMQTYGHDSARLQSAFVDFVDRLPFYGRAVVCSDDAGVNAVLPRLQRPLLRYGLGESAELRAVDVCPLPGARMGFVALQPGQADLAVELRLAGVHNVRNALAAIAVAREFRVEDDAVVRALASFGGVGRRFENHGSVSLPGAGSFMLIDDYGHHPVEMAAVLDAARGAFAPRRIVLAFQPHRYSRTRDCAAGFIDVFQRFDAVVLTEVYAAGEAPLTGADGGSLFDQLQRAPHDAAAQRITSVFVPQLADLPQALADVLRDGDVLITMGAGSIAELPARLKAGAMDGGRE